MANTDQIELNEQKEDTKLDLQAKINEVGSCQRHIVVTIPRAEVDRYFRKNFDELCPKAELPGFRPGKAPRKLVESRFREQIRDQVKASLLMDSIAQITEGGDFSPISEPDLDVGAVDLRDEGDFHFEFNIEVRPVFELPNWRGINLVAPSYEITDADIDEQLGRSLEKFAKGEPVDGPAQLGDTLVVNIEFRHGDRLLATLDREKIVLRPKLSLADATYDDFGKLLEGVREGESRTATINIDERCSEAEMRGAAVEMEIEVVDVIRLDISNLNARTLDDLGFDSVDELREFVREELSKRQKYYRQQELRSQIVQFLASSADFDLPKELVSRQTARELQRQMLELRRSGFGDNEIRAYMNATRRDAEQSTIRALREHFILEKIADEEKIDASPEEYDDEIELIAEQSDSSPRVVRARLEKTGSMDAIRNQIVERKVIELIAASAQLVEKEDRSFLTKVPQETAIDLHVVAVSDSIPEAKYDERPEDGKKEGATVKLNSP